MSSGSVSFPCETFKLTDHFYQWNFISNSIKCYWE